MRIARLLYVASSAVLALTPAAGAQARSAAATQREDAAIRTAIEAAAARAAESFNRGDIAGVVRDYAEDVWVFPPNAQPYQGSHALLDYHARNYRERGLRNLRLTTTGFERSGHLAYETGTYTIDVPTGDRAGTMDRSHGKYIQIWKRDAAGDWRIHHVMWSSNVPPSPAPR